MSTAGPLPQIDLARIRSHETSQQRAWEELGFILVPDMDQLPPSTRLERRATPDAGVEFSCPAPGTASEMWAWQSKYLFKLDSGAFAQMAKSVVDALDANPNLTRYAFILPVDRSAITRAGARGGMQRWDESVERWKRAATERGMAVDFAYFGHSDVVRSLSSDRHAGAVRYFFDEQIFTPDFFRRQVGREIENLGGRYDPKVHVDLEVSDSIEALSRSPRWAGSLADLISEAADQGAGLRPLTRNEHVALDPSLVEALTAAADCADRVAAKLHAGRRELTTPDATILRSLLAVVEDCAGATERAERALQDAAASIVVAAVPTPLATKPRRRGSSSRSVPERDPARTRRNALYDAAGDAAKARHAANGAARALTSREAEAADVGALLIDGPAGCGKSHLVADAAASRVGEGAPTLLILGQHLRPGPIWSQIAEAVDLPLTGQDLCATLEIAARVRGAGRALLVIDAVNEGPGRELWRDQLNGLLTDLARHPWLAVVLTVRDTYAPVVLPEETSADSLVRLTHPGLVGHEEEALARYADHFSLRLPDLPPLLPEFRNPLFLRSMCLSVKAQGLSSIPREAASLTWVFDGLLDAVNQAVSEPSRLDVDVNEHLVQRAADALALAMLDTDSEILTLVAARSICLTLHPERRHSRSLLTALISEGVLLRETNRMDSDSHPQEVVRFTYQRLADHLRADAVVATYVGESDLRDAVLALASGPRRWSRSGILEALVLIVPERCGRELADIARVLPHRKPTARGPRDRGAPRPEQDFLGGILGRAFFNNLPWRAVSSFTSRTLELLEQYLHTDVIDDYEWLALYISLACVPDHPLNADRLDAALRRMTLPERDRIWSSQLLWIWGADFDPVTRTVDWAWSRSSNPPDNVAELAATLLAWFCTSPNRRLRDTSTKALVRLLDGRTATATRLVRRFADVNDPYVVERVLAAACGHVLRHRGTPPPNLDDFVELGRAANDAVFGSARPTTHALIRHYARTVVETVEAILGAGGTHLDRDLSAVRPPYQSGWPLTAPSLRDLARRHGKPGERHVTSATTIGYDFKRYILERGLAADFALPDQQRRLTARRTAARREKQAAAAEILALLPPEDRQPVIDLLERDEEGTVPQLAVTFALDKSVPEAGRAALAKLERARRRLHERGPVRPDVRLMCRWIANRVLDLGWTPEHFADQDTRLESGRSGGWSETERFGKKYSWIAYHELIGVLGDHCLVDEGWRDTPPERYEHPFQVDNAVDLDPSIVLRGDEPRQDTAAGRLRALRHRDERRDTWWLSPYERELSADRDGAGWLLDMSDLPNPHEVLAATDPAGDVWLVVELHQRWNGKDRSDGHKRQLWVRTQAMLTQETDLSAFRSWAPKQNWMGLWMPTPSDFSAGYLGGHHDQEPWRRRRLDAAAERRRFDEAQADDPLDWQRTDAHTAPDRPFALATSYYTSPSSRDESARDLPGAPLLSPALMDLLNAQWSGGVGRDIPTLGLGPTEAEYSWTSQGRTVAFTTAGRAFGSTTALFVRADTIGLALAQAGLAMWSWVLGEKIYWRGHEPQSARTELYGAASLGNDGPTEWGLTVEHVDWTEREGRRRRIVRR